MSAALMVLPMVWATAQRENVLAEDVVSETASETVAEKTVPTSLAFYRKYTEALLRRYAHMAMETGRVPSLLGRELFRGKVTNYVVHGFDDVVIFVHDVEQCLQKLDLGQQQLVERIGLQEYTLGEAAGLLGLSLRTAIRKYARALDQLTEVFLDRKLLDPSAACQGVEAVDKPISN